MKAAATPDQVHSQVEDQYGDFEQLISKRVAGNRQHLFTTNALDILYDVFLRCLPEDRRQHYNCNCCRRFVEKYGGLVTIADGVTESLLWNHAPSVPAFFLDSVLAMQRLVESAKVTGVFLSEAAVWGTPQTGTWTHLSGTNSDPYKNSLKTAEQEMAEKLQDCIMLKRGLNELKISQVRQALTLLEADALHRSEKAVGIVRWLLQLMENLDAIRFGKDNRTRKDNIIWEAVASAPPGYCHIRTTMIASLLDDVQAGLPVEDIQRRWAAKIHPLQYQRPTAPLNEGLIKRAEEIVEKLGIASALKRRFAKLEEIKRIWLPKILSPDLAARSGSVFDHLRKTTELKQLEVPPKKITWTRFKSTVLETALQSALSIELQVSHSRSGFYGLVTAEDPNAPPILQWDDVGQRNPVSWYFYHGGSYASGWNLAAGSWVKVNAIADMPPHWFVPDLFNHQPQGALLVLEGCWDMNHQKGGGFFPEMLKAEYREVRSVMEAHANSATIAGKEQGTANGLGLMKNNPKLNSSPNDYNVMVRVKTREGLFYYLIDRWE